MRKQQLWTGIGASLGMLILILDGKTALEGARQGVELCLRTVIPSLFPFFLLSILLTGSFMGLRLSLLRPAGRLFSLPQGAESILISAFLGGYPVGAQCLAEASRAGQLERRDTERLLAFCNNAGPAFLFGMVASMFPRQWMAWALWGIHIVSAWMVSALLPGGGNTARLDGKASPSLSSAMVSAVTVMSQVCGWVVLFRVVIAFLHRWALWLLPTAAQVAVTGLLELSNGCCDLAAIEDVSLRFVVCSGILAFGGLCVTMQTISVTRGLSLKHYFLGKGLQTLFSLFLSAAVVWKLWAALPAIALFFALIPHKIRKNSSNPLPIGV